MAGRRRRTFTAEFKAEAIRLVTEQGHSYAEAARQLGISENSLRRWKQALDARGQDAFPGRGRRSAQEEEIARLLAENRRLRQEREILKKATAFFAGESP